MRIRRSLLVAVLSAVVLLLLPAAAHATTYYVAVNGTDTASGLSTSTAFATVPQAVSVAASGDVVAVGPGTFNGAITMKDGVSLLGAGAAETTLTGGSTGVTANGIGMSTSISGFTISGNGDGIDCDGPDCSPTITNDTFTGNDYGIFCTGPDCSPTITNDTFTGNTDGIYCYGSSSPSITNDTISGNGVYGIICYDSSSPSITNDTITGNTVAGIWCGNGSSPSITNCIVWDNTGGDLSGCSATYSDTAGGTGTNISADPSFVASATGDFHLNADSPCIDDASPTVAPATDKDGTRRPFGLGFDMGAYEFSTYRLHYAASTGGSIVGSATQVVSYNSSGMAVTASPATGFHFGKWSDNGTAATRTDANVTAEATYTASFAINTYTLHYQAADANGSIVGSATQVVGYNTSGLAVTASPATGYHFVMWSDNSTANPRTDSNVTADAAYAAMFAVNPVYSTTTKLSGSSRGKRKKSYKLTGSVWPAGPGKVTITITRLVTKKWKGVAAPKVNVSNGKFSYSFKAKYKGKWRFTATYSGGVSGYTTYKTSKSSTKTITVK